MDVKPKLPLAEDIASNIRRYLASVIRPMDKKDIDAKWATEQYNSKRDERQYDNEFAIVVDESLYLIIETTQGISTDQPNALIYFWNNYLLPLHSLTFYWKGKNNTVIQFRAFFPVNSNEHKLLLTTPTRVVILREGRCLSAYEFNLSSADQKIWDYIDPTPPFTSVTDLAAAKAWVEGKIRQGSTPEEMLEFGWARRLDSKLETAIRFSQDTTFSGEWKKEQEVVQASPYAEFFENQQNAASHIYNAFERSFSKEGPEWVIGSIKILSSLFAEATHHHEFFRQIMECAWFSSNRTSRGLIIYSLELDGSITPISLDTLKLGLCVKHFWDRIGINFPFYYKQLIGSGSCPIDIQNFVLDSPLYEGEIYKGEEFVSDLLAEATALKQWTIPHGAYVQLEVGLIKAAKLYEIGKDVACILVDESGHYLIAWIDPSSRTMSIPNQYQIRLAAAHRSGKEHISKNKQIENLQQIPNDEEMFKRIELGLKILLAGIIRDFWVVEERETVFGAGLRTKNHPRLKSDRNEKVVVYLPRIRYVGDIRNHGDALAFVARRAHFVTGHLRKAVTASELQIEWAKRHGIVVPEGFTFVRPHKRGGKAQEKIYRSRSALQCIRALRNSGLSITGDEWFIYELNVKQWLSSNGFEVEHLAASRNGDGGVDIQASKGTEHLLLQCKYWRTTKIGPAVIREMIGTLESFPKGSRGVIVTSSELTEGAKQLAIAHEIQYIEGAEFGTNITKRL